ncbi:MAG: hypothetical protein J5I93_16990 [Pirellulaceae bacterium]|nr:hypothetical protein [Pirellulaceae bacterium]
MKSYRTCRVLVLALCAALGMGCGGGRLPVDQGVIVRVKLLKGGQPLSGAIADLPPGVEGTSPFEIALVPQGGADAAETHLRGMYYGEYSPADGVAVFRGPGKGIPAGRYTLTVRALDVMPGDAENDPLGGKFDIETSTLVFDIPPDQLGKEYDLPEIDLDSPPGS